MKAIDDISDEFLPTRKSLLTRLKNWDDQEGWREFFDMYWKLIYSVAVKAGLNDAEAQDVLQETVIAVARKMRGFKYDPAVGLFKGWLLLNIRSRITEHLRKKSSRKGSLLRSGADGADTDFFESVADPALSQLEASWDAE
jgi:RNA polymerase sigma-70 factor (ECF subfamily)